MTSKTKMYFVYPMHGFALTVMLGLMSWGLVSANLLHLTQQHYRDAISELPALAMDVKMLNDLTKNVVLQRQEPQTEPPLGTTSSTSSGMAQSDTKRTFKFLLIDEKSVFPDPECRACMLKPEKQQQLALLLDPLPETLFLYTILDDKMIKVQCGGKTKFSECIQQYLNERIDSKRISIHQLDEHWTTDISAKNTGAFVILSNSALTLGKFKKIEKQYGLSNVVGFHSN